MGGTAGIGAGGTAGGSAGTTAGRAAGLCGSGRRTPSEVDGWVSRMKRGAVATIVGGWARLFVSDLGMA